MTLNPMTPEALVCVHRLSVRFGETLALENTKLDLHAHDFWAVIGPNGAGKSTLLKAMLGLVPTTRGHVHFAQELGDPKQNVAYVPQQQSLDWSFPISVFEAVLMGRTRQIGWLRHAQQKDRDAVQHALETAGIQDLAHKPVAVLSGGQKQRVLIARMLARQARVLLLDEPFNGVDATSQERIFELLEQERTNGKSILMVTHDLVAAERWCNHLMLLNRRVVASGPPAQVYTPNNITATFAGQAPA